MRFSSIVYKVEPGEGQIKKIHRKTLHGRASHSLASLLGYYSALGDRSLTPQTGVSLFSWIPFWPAPREIPLEVGRKGDLFPTLIFYISFYWEILPSSSHVVKMPSEWASPPISKTKLENSIALGGFFFSWYAKPNIILMRFPDGVKCLACQEISSAQKHPGECFKKRQQDLQSKQIQWDWLKWRPMGPVPLRCLWITALWRGTGPESTGSG